MHQVIQTTDFTSGPQSLRFCTGDFVPNSELDTHEGLAEALLIRVWTGGSQTDILPLLHSYFVYNDGTRLMGPRSTFLIWIEALRKSILSPRLFISDIESEEEDWVLVQWHLSGHFAGLYRRYRARSRPFSNIFRTRLKVYNGRIERAEGLGPTFLTSRISGRS